MPRHDYQLPSDWEEMSDEEKSRWYTQERCRRQAMRQDTPAGRALKRQAERATDTEQRVEDDEVHPSQDTQASKADGHAV